jgi:hypothetical protein
MVILHMDLKVLGEMLDALAEKRNLHFRRTCVRRMNPELLNHLLFLRFSNPHISALFSLFPFLVVGFLTYWSHLVKQQVEFISIRHEPPYAERFLASRARNDS